MRGQASEPRRILNLVTSPQVNGADDFEELATRVSEVDPETLTCLVTDTADHAKRLRSDLPTLTVSPGPLRHFHPPRGPVLQGRWLPKSAEYRALEAIGVPIPRWQRLLPGRRPDVGALGKYVVTKPDFGARGADVRVERGTKATWTPPRTDLSRSFGGDFNPRVAQEFIYTGPWPSSHRVATLFGRALFALRIEASHARAPLDDVNEHRGQSVVSSGKGCTFSLVAPPDVLELAERAHAALPDVPLLGVDIVRAAHTGRLFVLELNSIGYTWHFSSPSGTRIQAEFGLDLAQQLDGRRRAAEVLAEVCAARAR